MKVAYARTSNREQIAGLEAQVRDLNAAGVEKIFSEQLSSVDAKRPQLGAAIDFIREGDVLVVTKIDRLALSVGNLVEIERRLCAKGASLQVLDPGLDTGSPMGRLVFNMVAAIAKAQGKYKGRKPKARAKAEEGSLC